jgi:hypothetical protein
MYRRRKREEEEDYLHQQNVILNVVKRSERQFSFVKFGRQVREGHIWSTQFPIHHHSEESSKSQSYDLFR